MERQKKFWVVSPNVNAREELLESWRHEILKRECVFMGWGDDHPIGRRFANQIQSGDVILIARRHNLIPEVVGFGVATGQFEWFHKETKTGLKFGSLHKLKPFRPLSRDLKNIPLKDALNHTMAVAQLHPEWNEKHKKICDWMEQALAAELGRLSTPEDSDPIDPRLEELQHQDESEYKVRGQEEAAIATREEAKLLNQYIKWLERQGRTLHIAKYVNLRCDAFEKERNNLIEAKRGNQREYIRMAAGQLLDYAFQGRERLGKPNLAILLPEKPVEADKQFGWLKENGIHLIWRDGNIFLDDDNGQFI